MRRAGARWPIPNDGGDHRCVKGRKFIELKSELEERLILVIDEISPVGPHRLAAVSERRRQCDVTVPSFGGIGVVFSGYFEQLTPIEQRSPIYNSKDGKSGGGVGGSSVAARLGGGPFGAVLPMLTRASAAALFTDRESRARPRSRLRLSATAP